ncbi:MAG: metallopeptidase [Candidatus Diapherotrites archaeon]|nr:metallopeptidase [Candidatus Diapherotrites archaeon]
MKYSFSQEWTQKTREIGSKAGMNYLELKNIYCIESNGTKTRRVIARIHSIGKAVQTGAGLPPIYVIELISEIFFKQNKEEQIKTIIHELLHIPKAFGGGFNGHRKYANKRNVEKIFNEMIKSDFIP